MASLSWESTALEFKNASPDAVMQCYSKAHPVTKTSLRVRRLARTIVVKKTGYGGDREFENQKLAWTVLNSTRLRVPEPIRYFENLSDAGFRSGFIIMEYLDGNPLHIAGSKANIDAAADAIRFIHTHSLPSWATTTRPGPPTGGDVDGFPWGQNGTRSFDTIDDLEVRVNDRLSRFATDRRGATFDLAMELRHEKLVLCHMDLAPRNILVLHDGIIAIVDWTSLALYPVIFEIACIHHIRDSVPLNERQVAEALLTQIWSDVVEDGTRKLRIVQDMSIRYLL